MFVLIVRGAAAGFVPLLCFPAVSKETGTTLQCRILPGITGLNQTHWNELILTSSAPLLGFMGDLDPQVRTASKPRSSSPAGHGLCHVCRGNTKGFANTNALPFLTPSRPGGAGDKDPEMGTGGSG